MHQAGFTAINNEIAAASSSVVLHPIGDLKARLFRRLCVANVRNSGAIAAPQLANPALIRRKIHRFY